VASSYLGRIRTCKITRQCQVAANGARDYDAESGRWTAKEPIGLFPGQNYYSYAANDPINLYDPFGTAEFDLENDPTVEQNIVDQANDRIQKNTRRIEEINSELQRQKTGSMRWNELRKLKNQLESEVKGLREMLRDRKVNAGGLLGKFFTFLGALDFIELYMRALACGRSFLEQLDIEAEREKRELREQGVKTNISCAGPFCLALDTADEII
jgi:RHS repeat-associated protein